MIEQSILFAYLAYTLCLTGFPYRNQPTLNPLLQKGEEFICNSFLLRSDKSDLYVNRLRKDFRHKLEVALLETSFLKTNQDLASDSFNETSTNKEITINAKTIPDLLEDSISKIRNNPIYRIKVPIVFPSVIHTKEQPLSPSITSVENGSGLDGYAITFFVRHKTECTSKGCIWGYINGFVIREDESTFSQELGLIKSQFVGYKRHCVEDYKCPSEEIEKTRQKVETAGFKKLSRDIMGLYTPAVCLGVNCRSAKIQWDEGKYRYQISLSKGSLEELLEMANSAIENQW